MLALARRVGYTVHGGSMAKYDKPLGESGIEWTNRTWGPTTGCDKVSAGCKFCYAEPLAERLQRIDRARAVNPGTGKYRNGFKLTLHPDLVTEPTRWKSSEWVFVNSMSDLLHASIPDAFLLDVFETMAVSAPWHRYQCLTKRAERWGELSALVVARFGAWPRNVLPGASVENVKARARIDELGRAGDEHTVRMLSVEPLLESLLDEKGVAGLALQLVQARIGWVITGGESGDHAREAKDVWFREVRVACALAGVPFFHKQFGGRGHTKEDKRGGTLAVLDGELHHAMPEVWAAPEPGRKTARTGQATLFG
jgi:protein gp37